MKKLLFLIALMYTCIGLKSQDIFTSGCFINENGSQVAAIFKNGGVMLRYEQQDRDLCSSAMAIDTVNNDIYWSVNSNPVNSISDGYVMKNEEIVLDNVLGTCINDISLDGGDIYSAGYMNDIYDATAAVWKNADLFYLHPFARDADFNACYYYDQSIYYVGYDHEDQGIIFKDGEQLCSLDFYYFYDVWVRPSPLAIAEIETDENSAVLIYNIFGELVKTVFSDNNFINISDLPSGFYIAKNGNHVVKFMK